MKKVLPIILSSLLLLVVVGCSDGLNTEGTGQLALSIVDAPGDYADVHVDIQRVAIKQDDGEWIIVEDYGNTPKSVNLLDYRVKELNVAGQDIPVGEYEEIAIVLGRTGYVKLEGDTTEYPLEVGEQVDDDDDEDEIEDQEDQAIEIEHKFTIGNDAIVKIQLDFNVAKMVKENDETLKKDYILEPAEVEARDEAEVTELEGEIDFAGLTPEEIAEIEINLYEVSNLNKPIATTYPMEEELEVEEHESDDEDEIDNKIDAGEFKFRGVTEGTYKLVITSPGYQKVTVEGIVFKADTEEIEIGEEDEEVILTITGADIVDEEIVLKKENVNNTGN